MALFALISISQRFPSWEYEKRCVSINGPFERIRNGRNTTDLLHDPPRSRRVLALARPGQQPRIVASGEAYFNKIDCLHAISLLQRSGGANIY